MPASVTSQNSHQGASQSNSWHSIEAYCPSSHHLQEKQEEEDREARGKRARRAVSPARPSKGTSAPSATFRPAQSPVQLKQQPSVTTGTVEQPVSHNKGTTEAQHGPPTERDSVDTGMDTAQPTSSLH
jgi:hypothetical protein